MTNKDRLLTSEPIPLITDDDFDHPVYPNKTRLKVIPDWDLLYTHQQNRCREIAEAQAIFTRQQTLQEVGEWLEEQIDRLPAPTSALMTELYKNIAQLKSGVMPQE